jgi:hypothetical protein
MEYPRCLLLATCVVGGDRDATGGAVGEFVVVVVVVVVLGGG